MISLLRRVEEFPRPTRVLIFNGSGVEVDESTLTMFAERWGQALGVSVRVAGDSSGANSSGLGAAIKDGVDALVVNPGSATFIDCVPSQLPTAFVGFSYPGMPEARFERGPLEDIAGRGLDGYRWAIRYLIACSAWPFSLYRYGEERDQVAELRLPRGAGPHPVIVLIHGGGWKALWRKDIMASMAVDLARRGLATWNIEFRRLGCRGGWPATFEDVAAAIDALAVLPDEVGVDRSRVVYVGHSSGGQLALWAAAENTARIRAGAVVSLAGVVDLVEGAKRELIGGEGVITKLLGGTPEDVPERYASTSPKALLPLGTPQVLLQGLSDYILDLVEQNRVYAREARACGDSVRLVEIEGAEHLDLIEPSSSAWPTVAAEIDRAMEGIVARL